MHNSNGCIEDVARGEAFRAPRAATNCFTWSSSAKVETQQASDYAALLVAIAGHDLRQPLQAIQFSHELLGRGIRSKSELRLLRSGQRAIDRLTAQLDQLLAALLLCNPQGVKPMPLQLKRVLQQIAYENEFEAMKKGVKLSVIPSSIAIQSDKLLFSAILRNLVRNAFSRDPLALLNAARTLRAASADNPALGDLSATLVVLSRFIEAAHAHPQNIREAA
jgi:signal transduction histidine kinase